ncbi:hypothetical protein Ancab_017573 [Ancistrocladus abbreviatus]
MDPCTFIRITVGNLALKFPSSSSSSPASNSKTTLSGLQQPPSTTIPSYHCKIKFADCRHQITALPLLPPDTDANCSPLLQNSALSACFNLSKSDIEKLLEKSKSKSNSNLKKRMNKSCLKIDVYSSGGGKSGAVVSKRCGLSSGGRFIGRVSMPVDLNHGEIKASGLHSGWIGIGEKKGKRSGVELHVSAKVELDPRFVFKFEGEPECSPQVVQVQGSCRQPVFSCKFSFRHSGDWNSRTSSSISRPKTSRRWVRNSFKGEQDQVIKERKGWSVTIHDLSGSPVAAASMVTPFVPLSGSDRVGKSNPGAWLILRPGEGTWKPWGRLEAWRERSSADSLGYRFELLPDAGTGVGSTGITLSNGIISSKTGGKFSIDMGTFNSPISSPSSSFDLGSWSGSGSESGSGWWPHFMYKGFVMSSTVGGERKEGSKPEVEVGVHHVTCTEDAAVFVALAAAMDLSMDACKLFSQKLRKELRQMQGEELVL